jgi:hypothetical protein
MSTEASAPRSVASVRGYLGTAASSAKRPPTNEWSWPPSLLRAAAGPRGGRTTAKRWGGSSVAASSCARQLVADRAILATEVVALLVVETGGKPEDRPSVPRVMRRPGRASVAQLIGAWCRFGVREHVGRAAGLEYR